MAEPLKILSAQVVSQLHADLQRNVPLYLTGNFTEEAKDIGWDIEVRAVLWDPRIVDDLDPSGSPEAEIRNSVVIYQGFSGMTPALAQDERVWVRLTHVEFFEFARARWLGNEESAVRSIRKHFFANGIPGCRDDNAIGRLWWNAHIANLAFPEDLEYGLEALLARANNRLQIVDRADTGFRAPLLRGILKLIKSDSWLQGNDYAIADLMKQVNKYSGCIVFETMDPHQIDEHLMFCLLKAKGERAAILPNSLDPLLIEA